MNFPSLKSLDKDELARIASHDALRPADCTPKTISREERDAYLRSRRRGVVGFIVRKLGGPLVARLFYRLERSGWPFNAVQREEHETFEVEPRFKHEKETLDALLDTICPRGADLVKQPGAVETLVTKMFFEPRIFELGRREEEALGIALSGVRLALCLPLDVSAIIVTGRRFKSLSIERRDRIFGFLYKIFPHLYEGTVMLTLWAYATGMFSRAGEKYIGVPGENEGHPDASYDLSFHCGATEDGNLP
ncbi:MAG: hypothetical protein NUW37_19650 [Planctomycetes bacterium]|nr:hypothetical protein [Planctomycetota bacterium]